MNVLCSTPVNTPEKRWMQCKRNAPGDNEMDLKNVKLREAAEGR